jgi:hypothetical protein
MLRRDAQPSPQESSANQHYFFIADCIAFGVDRNKCYLSSPRPIAYVMKPAPAAPVRQNPQTDTTSTHGLHSFHAKARRRLISNGDDSAE